MQTQLLISIFNRFLRGFTNTFCYNWPLETLIWPKMRMSLTPLIYSVKKKKKERKEKAEGVGVAHLWASRLMHSPSEHVQHITFQLISSQHAGTRNIFILHLSAGLPPPATKQFRATLPLWNLSQDQRLTAMLLWHMRTVDTRVKHWTTHTRTQLSW